MTAPLGLARLDAVAILPSARDAEAQRIHQSWLVRLRWGAVVGQLATALFVDEVMHIALPLRALFLVIGLEAAGNVGCMLWARREGGMPQHALGLSLAADTVMLTLLLFLTGGPFNPFSFLYLVHIALSAVVLPATYTWGLVALAIACYGSLFLRGFFPLAIQTQLSHADQMRMHMNGMWWAFSIAAAFIAYFVSRVRQSLAEREAELMRARALAARSERLASLATLATGAAHELSTPLSTIAIAAKELERALAQAESKETVADAQLIRREVERCRQILQRMAADAGQNAVEEAAPVPLSALIDSALEGLRERERVRAQLGSEAGCVLHAQPQATAQALRSVVKNALQASPAGSAVEIAVTRDGAQCRIAVRDSGEGMSEEVLARAGEPFFTTKAPGEGMGLGLFLTRMIIEQSGGSFELQSRPGTGTTAIVAMPIAQSTGAST
ncbi:MAG TPA: ATP-binding protein [Polyangiales bacterium]|nr:ATP-binding protein [Polyangiales bacterium]